MEQIKVSDLATEFDIQYTIVISELKKIGVWVPSADTPVDPDIAIRIRRRLQLMVETEHEEQARAEKAKEKKAPAAKAKKTIKELGQPRKAAGRKIEEKPVETALASSLKPRRGKGVYRRPEEEVSAELTPEAAEAAEAERPEVVEAPAAEQAAPAPVEATPAEAAETAQPTEAAEETKPAEVPAEPVAAETAAAEAAPVTAQTAQPAPEAKEPAEPPAAETPAPPPAPAVAAAHEARPVTHEPPKEKPAEKPTILKKTSPEPVAAPPQQIVRQLVRTQPPPRPDQRRAPVYQQPYRRPGDQQRRPMPGRTRPSTPAPAPVAKKPEIPRETREVMLPESVTVKELCEKLGVKSKDMLRELLGRGIMVSINQTLDQKTLTEVCMAFNAIPRFVSFEEAVMEEEKSEEKAADVKGRAPVVTVMGHVDHGKTSLLDAIRKTKVAAGEAGGITQHIGAYHVNINERRIVFIDTPGHEAFTMMRARGAKATDIVVLVVAADDGVMPQTVEAINHARAAKVPIMVAINKVDKPEADPQRVKQELTKYELVAEEWGGETVMVEVSAKEKTNLDLLLEMILLSADMLELKGNPLRSATGVVLEARLDKGRGAVATVLVQNGTLKVGDTFIAGAAYGKIRAMFDDRGNPVIEAGPSSAVEVLGLQNLPQAGDSFQVMDDTVRARQIGEYRQTKIREKELVKSSRVSLDDLYAQMQTGEVKELPIVLKADAQGSVEVVEDALQKLSGEKVKIRIIHRGVGAISESDVLLASASNAIVIGFNVRPEQNAESAAEHEEVEIRLYTVIYDIANEIRQAMLGLLEPTVKENYQGKAEVRQTFRVPKQGTVAGSYVLDGTVTRNSELRLLRDNVVIYEGRVGSLRRFKEDVAQVKAGYECGIAIANFNDIKVGDVIEAFVKERVEPQLA
ncbi:MAG: translation initiation factor IF-2 [Acidobacteria bacterium]|nr:MAG: translation initiation factor IF-2 [Acidobacteriota bacterium]